MSDEAATRDPVKATQTQQLVGVGAGSLVTGTAAGVLLSGAVSPELANRVTEYLAASGPMALVLGLAVASLWAWGRRGYTRVEEVLQNMVDGERAAAILLARSQADALAKLEASQAAALAKLEKVQADYIAFFREMVREEPKL